MKQWTADKVRASFLDFFRERGHTVVPSASLVPLGDPTLLFTNAGMNQFKDVFLGLSTREYTRAVDSQKVMRVSGKHNDLEEVGRDGYHHTFFEMLGNWSFGDYYKKEAISWAWQLLTDVWKLPKDKLYATVFRDEKGELETDEEAAGFWRAETDIDPDHILYFGRKDNLWEMGDTGPCGPDSEIHLDRGPSFCSKQGEPGHMCAVNGDCGRYIELWNLVFIQYNRVDEQTLEPLPSKHVDTGAGFERLVSVLEGTRTNYDTDLFSPIMDRTQELLGHTDAQRGGSSVAYQVIADHSRAITFLCGDGVMPGNEGREYVLRMILRRAARFGRELGFDGPFLAELAQVVIDVMGEHYGELKRRRDFILNTITQEEDRFLHTLDRGLARVAEILQAARAEGRAVMSGREAFVLWTQDGFPYDLIRDIADENGMTVDRASFEAEMAEHRKISGRGGIGELDIGTLGLYSRLLQELQGLGRLPTEGVSHRYAEGTTHRASVLALLRVTRPEPSGTRQTGDESVGEEHLERVQALNPGDRCLVVLDETPFYVESGGQVSDKGVICNVGQGAEPVVWKVSVEDVSRPVPGMIVHAGRVETGNPQVGQSVQATVDPVRRMDIARNHTATHLLHGILRTVLGAHVQQSGSLVAGDRLRFDFSHGSALSRAQLDEVECRVNAAVLEDLSVGATDEGYAEAVASGAMALFGEKYGESVRVINIGAEGQPFSRELCGGVHVQRTSQIGLFRILSEGSVAAGVRRIEAVTGSAAQRLAQGWLNLLDETASALGCPPEEVRQKVLALLEDQQRLSREIGRLQRELARLSFESLLEQVRDVSGVAVLSAKVDAPNVDTLREMSDWFRERIGSGVIVLGAEISDRPSFVAAVTDDLVDRGLHAGRLIKRVAQVVGGGGGGRPTIAQAGGRNVERLPEALALVADLVRAELAT